MAPARGQPGIAEPAKPEKVSVTQAGVVTHNRHCSSPPSVRQQGRQLASFGFGPVTITLLNTHDHLEARRQLNRPRCHGVVDSMLNIVYYRPIRQLKQKGQ